MDMQHGLTPAKYMGLFSYALKRGKRAVRGVRTSQIPFVVIIGSNEGLRCADYARLYLDGDTSPVNIFERLSKMVAIGMVRRDSSKRYYLTTSGWTVYNAVMSEWDRSLADIQEHIYQKVTERLRAEGKIG